MVGYRTYISVVVMAFYNLVFPLLGIKDISMDTLDTVINVILLIAIAVFHKIHKVEPAPGPAPKVLPEKK